MKLRLLCRDSLSPHRELNVERFPAVLGRGPESEVRIDDRWLSRKHCRIDVADGVLVVRDLCSRHGTFINGQAIRECQLLPGDELCIGLTHFRAEYELEFVPAGEYS